MNVMKENSNDVHEDSSKNYNLMKSIMHLSKNLESGLKEQLFYPTENKLSNTMSNETDK